jgi:hypothetical protein
MSTVSQYWTDLKSQGRPLPFMLIDCAGLPGGQAALPASEFSEVECLFTGDLAVELKDVAPYLARFRSYAGEQEALADELVRKGVGALVTLPGDDQGANLSFSLLHRHFRRFNVVYAGEGTPHFFRYYDPRVLVDVLSVFEPQQLEAFFGPVDSFIVSDPQRAIVRCGRNAGTLSLS